jgi:hypothetical protein
MTGTYPFMSTLETFYLFCHGLYTILTPLPEACIACVSVSGTIQLPRRGLVMQVFIFTDKHTRWFVEVCLCMALSCKAFLLKKKQTHTHISIIVIPIGGSWTFFVSEEPICVAHVSLRQLRTCTLDLTHNITSPKHLPNSLALLSLCWPDTRALGCTHI